MAIAALVDPVRFTGECHQLQESAGAVHADVL